MSIFAALFTFLVAFIAFGAPRVTPEIQQYIYKFEETRLPHMTPDERAQFQTWVGKVGGKMRTEISLPADNQPYWLREKGALYDYQSAPNLPERVDVLIIGAGLTGVSAAYHMEEFVRQGLSVAVIEAGNIGEGSSGRNGGNFELMPENFKVKYEYLVRERFKYLREFFPRLTDAELLRKAKRQARTMMQFGQRNALRFLDIVHKNNIDADVSDEGWLRIAENEEEVRGFEADAKLARSLGIKVEILTKEEIKARFNIDAEFAGRLIYGFGNYHPYKFLVGAMKVAISRGINLFTNTKVTNINTNDPKEVIVESDRGAIRTSRVIVATNAYTSEFLPELKAIHPYQSQIFTLEHVEDHLKGITYTGHQGDQYANIPKGSKYVDENGVARGTLLVGGGEDTPIKSASQVRQNPEVFKSVKGLTDKYHPDTVNQPPSAGWAGPMGFTDDRAPLIGFLVRNGKEDRRVGIAAGFSGYGGSYCVEAGYLVGQMVMTGKYQKGAPPDIFAPQRFFLRQCQGLF